MYGKKERHENAHRFGGMSERSDAYRRRAEAAQSVRDPDIRAVYPATAVRQRRMAEQQDE